MQDGSLACCSYDKGSGIRAWSDHVLGGKNAFVLQCETTMESNTDLLWLVVRREVDGEAKVFLELLPPPFDPVEEDEFEQRYTDSGVMIQNKRSIENIVNASSFFVDIQYNEEQFTNLSQYLNLTSGNLIVALEGGVRTYINPELNYNNLGLDGFFVSAFGGAYTISEKNRPKMENAWYLFETSIAIKEIRNRDGIGTEHYIFVATANANNLLAHLDNEVLVLTGTGIEGLDNRCFRIYNPSPAGFLLAGINGGPISIDLENEPDVKNIRMYIGKRAVPNGISCRDGYIEFSENIFNESVNGAELHTARLSMIKGATKYNGYDYSLKLTNIDNNKYRYGLYYNAEDEEGIEYVANSFGYGTYDQLLDENGFAYFYFQFVSREEIKHLIGQTVCYTINGNFPYRVFFDLTEDMFDAEGKFRLYQSSASTDFGLPYTAELETTPLSGGSMFGSSEGQVGTQTEVVLSMYASLGGQFGPYAPKDAEEEDLILEDIQYPFADVVGKERQLETSSIRVPIQNNKDVTLRKVYLKHDEPVSFNVLSIVQDVVVSDG